MTQIRRGSFRVHEREFPEPDNDGLDGARWFVRLSWLAAAVALIVVAGYLLR